MTTQLPFHEVIVEVECVLYFRCKWPASCFDYFIMGKCPMWYLLRRLGEAVADR